MQLKINYMAVTFFQRELFVRDGIPESEGKKNQRNQHQTMQRMGRRIDLLSDR